MPRETTAPAIDIGIGQDDRAAISAGRGRPRAVREQTAWMRRALLEE